MFVLRISMLWHFGEQKKMSAWYELLKKIIKLHRYRYLLIDIFQKHNFELDQFKDFNMYALMYIKSIKIMNLTFWNEKTSGTDQSEKWKMRTIGRKRKFPYCHNIYIFILINRFLSIFIIINIYRLFSKIWSTYNMYSRSRYHQLTLVVSYNIYTLTLMLCSNSLADYLKTKITFEPKSICG